MVRALALAVPVAKDELDSVLPRAGATAENLRDRKEIEHALLRLCGQLLEPLRRRLCRAQPGRKGEDYDERGNSFGHSPPQLDGV